MNLEDIRPSFSIYVVSPRLEALEGAVEALGLAGYLVSIFDGIDLAFASVATNPPHVIVVEDDGGAEAAREVAERVYTHLPETHVILLAPLTARSEYVRLLERSVYDVVFTPVAAAIELQRAIDRAVERDYYMYQNERLVAAPVEAAMPIASHCEDTGSFATDLFAQRTVDECLTVFLESVGGRGVFFRYLANRRTLVAAVAVGLASELTNGIGLNLNEEVDGFQARQLREPMRLPAFRQMIESVFDAKTYVTRVLEVAGEVAGIFVLPDQAQAPADLDDKLLLVDRAIGLLETQRRLHVVNIRDDGTEVLSRANFVECVTNEVSRARRLNLPVALLAMAFDQYDLIGSEIGSNEATLMLKTVAKLCEKYSRVNDAIGRLGTSELGLLLPHTSRRGALIKAERLRRALAQADFSKVVRTHARVTVSIGVAEYPTLVRDADELLSSADETLFHIRKQGNRTAVAEVPANLTPDFVVRDLG